MSLSLETCRQVLTCLPPHPVPPSLCPNMLSGALRWAANFPPLQPRPGGALGSFPAPSGHNIILASQAVALCSRRHAPSEILQTGQSHSGRNTPNRKQKGAGTGGREVFSLTGTVTRGWGPAPLVSHCTYSPLGWQPKEKRTYAVVGGLMGQCGAF